MRMTGRLPRGTRSSAVEGSVPADGMGPRTLPLGQTPHFNPEGAWLCFRIMAVGSWSSTSSGGHGRDADPPSATSFRP
jgi:hypothetical protein